MMRYFLLALACPMLVAGALAERTVTIRVEGLSSSETSRPAGLAEYRILQEFKRRFPHVNVQPTEGLKIEGLGAEITPLMMIAGGIAPDVLSVNFRRIDSYVRQGFLYPLDEFIEEAEARNPGWIEGRILPQVKPVIYRQDAEGKPHCYALPLNYAVMGLYYNRSLFREAGLPMRAPRDWEELAEFARRISALDPRYKGLALSTGQQAAWNLMSFLWSSGGEAVVETEPNVWTAAFNSEGAIDAFEFYHRLVEGEKLAIRGNLTMMNNSGEMRRVGMQFGYIGSQTSLDPNVWGFGAVPAGPTGMRGAEVNARMLGIFAGVKDPAVRQAAWELIRFFSSAEAQKIRVDTYVEMGLANQINPADLRQFGYSSFLELAEPGFEEEIKKAFETAKPEPYGRNCSLVYVEMTYPLDQILFNSIIAEAWARGDRAGLRAEIQRILNGAAAQTNERMLGVIPEKTMQMRRVVAWVVVLVILAAFAVVGRMIFQTFADTGRGASRARGIQKFYAWGLLAIPLGLTFVWQYLPLARGAFMALLDYQLLLRSTFVGIDNFANVLFDPRFWKSMAATVHFAFWLLTAGFAVPILLAYLLHLVPRQKVLFRTIYYLPALLSGAALFVLWRQFFQADGFVNEMLNLLGIPLSRAWADDPVLAMLSCVLPTIWAGAGPGCLIYLAALKTIPEEQFEAAEIDGAGFWKKTRHIIFPGLKPLIIINFAGAVTAAFQSSQNVLIMTGGGPNGTTEVAALRIFYEAFMFLNFGPATAMAWILGAMLIGFTALQLRRLSQMEFRSGGR
jgi:ABC-type sugar transport system permease subunit/ABC-type glycerol-3-phosphate transport system substrate-binding protein